MQDVCIHVEALTSTYTKIPEGIVSSKNRNLNSNKLADKTNLRKTKERIKDV